jgi:hypothetical protein
MEQQRYTKSVASTVDMHLQCIIYHQDPGLFWRLSGVSRFHLPLGQFDRSTYIDGLTCVFSWVFQFLEVLSVFAHTLA